jgi:hypothetical protein
MLSTSELQHEVRAHYHDDVIYEKEMSETRAVFRLFATDEPCQLLSLCCGSCVGSETFADFFPHAASTLHGIDLAQRQTTQFMLEQRRLHSFVCADLFQEPPPTDALALMQTSTHWTAIHACRGLANRIVHLFREHAPAFAQLVVVPCCLFKDSELKAHVGLKRWKEIRAIHQGRWRAQQKPAAAAAAAVVSVASTQSAESSHSEDAVGSAPSEAPAPGALASSDSAKAVDWRLETAVQARNEALAAEFPHAFERELQLTEIQSFHNRALLFRLTPLASAERRGQSP